MKAKIIQIQVTDTANYALFDNGKLFVLAEGTTGWSEHRWRDEIIEHLGTRALEEE